MENTALYNMWPTGISTSRTLNGLGFSRIY